MSWYKQDGLTGIAFSSRIRLARNLRDIPFPERLSEDQAGEVAATVSRALHEIEAGKKWHDLDLQSIDPLHRQALVERHLVSREMTADRPHATLLVRDDERLGVLVNEEDHMRIQALRPGSDLCEAYAEAADLADRLEAKLPIAVSPRYGYLTSCPTNVGTGMRASVMLHLPALGRADLLPKLVQTLSRSGFTLRGYNGEGSRSEGDLYQISNQVTLGRAENDIIRDLNDITEQVIASENKSREAFQEADPVALGDRVGRAYGILANAQAISYEEAMQLMSALREGIELGVRTGPDMETINGILLQIGPASVQWINGREMDARSRDVARADVIKKVLKEKHIHD